MPILILAILPSRVEFRITVHTDQGGIPTKTGYRPTKTGYRPTKTGYRPTKTGYRPTKTVYRPTKTGYRPIKPGATRGVAPTTVDRNIRSASSSYQCPNAPYISAKSGDVYGTLPLRSPTPQYLQQHPKPTFAKKKVEA